MSFLLMVFLTLVCLFERYPSPVWPSSPEESALVTLLAVALVGLHAFWVSRRVSWPLARDPSRRDVLLGRYERWRLLHQFFGFGVYLVVLALLGWGWAVPQLWRWNGQPLPAGELWILAPFLLSQTLTWLFFYDADRAAHRAAHRLLDADPFSSAWLDPRPTTPPPSFGGRWTYVAFQLRQKLALVLIPVLLLVTQKVLLGMFPASWARWQGVVNVLAILVVMGVFVGMPLLIRFVLGLGPLPDGVLRDRLLVATRRLGFRCSDILLWNTRSGMANAMVIGLVPWLRYVVFTDRLLEEFSEDEVEAVFGHEIGHIRHQHMLYYLVFLTLSMAVLGLVAEYHVLPVLGGLGDALAEAFPSFVPDSLGALLGPGGDLSLFPVVGLLLGYIFLVFGYLSRQCERQADVFGCRAVSCLDVACEGHVEETALPIRGQGLCPTGIRTFIRALEKVADVNGISRDRPGFLQSWQHSTIARRVEFLQRVLREPDIEAAFQRRLWRVKLGLMVGLVTVMGLLMLAHGWHS